MIKKTKYIQDTKKLLGQLPTVEAPLPEYLYIATDNARCGKADLYIKEGDHVNCCQLIGMRHAAFFDQPIHATVSGTFEGYERHYHRSGKLVNFIKIHNDHLDTMDPAVKERSDEEIAKLTKDDVTKILKDCASVGLGGSSFPTYVKMQTNATINHILINGIECEPYISTDQRLMAEKSNELLKGMMILNQIFHCHDAKLCIKKKHAHLIEVYEEILRRPEYQ